MTGIVFFGTADRDRIVDFYTERMAMDVWLEQPGCTILRFESQLVGFCDADDPDLSGTITFVYDSREVVDQRYALLEDVADDPPSENERYQIYNFFGTDPEGRTIEVQTFVHPTDPV